MKKLCILTALILMAGAVLLPLGTALADQTGTVHGGWLILRSEPSFNGTILSSYPNGTVVTITGKNGSWYAVITPDGMRGYMLGSYLRVSGEGSASQPAEGTAYVTSANGLNVRLRTGPGTGYSVLASYAPGTRCTILSSGSNWCRIQIGSYTGYMMSRYLTTGTPATPVPPTPSGEGYEAWVTSANGKGVNLRSGPGKNYQSIGFYSVGTQASVLTYANDWSYIRIGSRTGYMMSRFLTRTQTQPTPTVPSGSPIIVSMNGRNVNLRSGPGKNYGVLLSVPVGTPVSVITRGMEWYYVRINGIYGYVMGQFVQDGTFSGWGGISIVTEPATHTNMT